MTYENLHNRELEQSVLSALMFDNYSDFNIMTDGLTAECFSDLRLRRLYQAMQTMTNEGLSIHDPMLVMDTMNRTKGADPEVGIAEFLEMVANDSGRMQVADNIPQYVGILIDLTLRRKMYNIITRATGHIVDLTQDIYTTISDLLVTITTDGGGGRNKIWAMKGMLEALIERVLKNAAGEEIPGYKTGFRRLDVTGGLHPSDLVIVAADSSQGKTAFATTIAMALAKPLTNSPEGERSLDSIGNKELLPSERLGGGSLAYYSMEMTPLQLVARMISKEAGISGSRMTYKRLDDKEQDKVHAAVKRLSVLGDRIFVDDRTVLTTESAIQSIRYLHTLHGVNIVIVDYLQILGLKTSNTVKRNEAIADAARKFKSLALELNIVIILLSQLNREGSLSNPQPSVARIRESGEINEASDLTLLIYRPEVYGDYLFPKPYEDIDTHGTAMITVGKDRHGSYGGVGSFIVRFNGEFSCFEDAEMKSLPRRSQVMMTRQKPWND